MNWIRHGGSTTFETKSCYCRVARQALLRYTAVARLGFKRRATAVLKSNLILSIEFGTAVARRLKRAEDSPQTEFFISPRIPYDFFRLTSFKNQPRR